MSLLEDVRNELVSLEDELPNVQKAQAVTMMRFSNGLRSENNVVVVRCRFESVVVAEWLDRVIRNHFGRNCRIVNTVRQTPRGKQHMFDVFVEHANNNAASLALQSGLIDRNRQVVRGLPSMIVSGIIPQIKAIWRGAFLARGFISEPGVRGYMEVVCPTREAAVALQGAARRLGITTAEIRELQTSHRVTIRDVDSIERLLTLMGATTCAREWTGKRVDNTMQSKTSRLANFDDANMRRSAKAASEACDRVRHAFDILGEDIPDNLKAAGMLRLEHEHASLAQLGALAKPQITKDAVAGRIRRLLQLADKYERSDY